MSIPFPFSNSGDSFFFSFFSSEQIIKAITVSISFDRVVGFCQEFLMDQMDFGLNMR